MYCARCLRRRLEDGTLSVSPPAPAVVVMGGESLCGDDAFDVVRELQRLAASLAAG